ncbi:DNA-invertase hin [Variibacter gotjawalensis]|uniref:DNA-invertase hin n=1 Tax=Variibacter gotjawalensis TaxID=1333996 RepID=A0A0S3PTX2_9BRAD|nr:recombinase family protein [Variibacter gotjawalensis]NIK49719.1 DNA invertase Pin-like site-specific DNA recombinase [Variibacter gotjawalensis]RZS45729.1 DNA invertase Pin-like site-specific DNA recombinase [Variibacter gotjawalensis]BAT59402.1 DNA-invertase hin [Variibacter gotjawalensis]
MSKTTSSKILRCAIYTRVSTEYGLEQAFNSLDAQREASEAYIKSQAHEGWRLQPGHYDDGGFSGGNLDRPALQKLLEAIRQRRIDVVVVYKVDRLTRTLADFAKLVELFDAHGVSFVSVTQSFNTTSSMGRLTLNVLLSFAQFEREVTGERIRDKVAASKRKGMCMGGPVPLGYDNVDKKLVPHPEEAETVREIFATYLRQRSLTKTVIELRDREIVTKRTRGKGGVKGGLPFAKNPLNHMLKNRLYVGEVGHKGKWFPGEHPGIVDKAVFDQVQEILTSQGFDYSVRRLPPGMYPLVGKIFDSAGYRMTAVTARKNGLHYRYYVSSARKHGDANAVERMRASADQLEEKIVTAIRSESGDVAVDDLFQRICKVVLRRDHVIVDITNQEFGETKSIRLPWLPGRIPHRQVLDPDASTGVASNSARLRSEKRARMLHAIARSRRWVDDLIDGKVRGLKALAKRDNRTERSVRMNINLAFAKPEIVEAIIAGSSERCLSLASMKEMPAIWGDQNFSVGEDASASISFRLLESRRRADN